jgi:hypothetical protein
VLFRSLAVSYFGATAVVRYGTESGETSRYLYASAVVAAVLAASLVQRRLRGFQASAVVVALAAFAVVANLGELRRENLIPVESEIVQARLAMVELVGKGVDPSYQPDPTRAPDIRAGPYFAAVEDYGSPAASIGEVVAAAERVRQEADAALAGLAWLRVEAPPGDLEGAAPPALERSENARATPSGGCTAIAPTGEGAAELVVPRSGIVVRAGGAEVAVRPRRFADGFGGHPHATVAAGQTAAFRPRPDRLAQPWHARLSAAGGFAICAAGP